MRDVVDADGFEGDFYEEDEPVSKIEADFAAGEHVLTGLPSSRVVGTYGILTVSTALRQTYDPRSAAIVRTGALTGQQPVAVCA